jgi:hypothetical protein
MFSLPSTSGRLVLVVRHCGPFAHCHQHHAHQSQRNVGAMHGLNGICAGQLMRRTAYTWAKSEGIDLNYDKPVPFKNERKLVKNLYAGLRFFAQQQFDALTSRADRNRGNKKTTG